MNQSDNSIINRTNIQSDVLVVNQCEINKEEVYKFESNTGSVCNVKVLSTTDRGLSRSRNMALRNASEDICLICDDDEILDNDYVQKISQAFIENPTADVIAFKITDSGKKYPKKKREIGYLRALKLASWQLAFRRRRIIDKCITFDESLGSGVSKAGGEENKFIYDCLRQDLKVIFVPTVIGRMIEGESQWWRGFTKEYFFDRGIMTKKLMGPFWASLYAVYFLLRKFPIYSKDIKFSTAASNLFRGLRD